MGDWVAKAFDAVKGSLTPKELALVPKLPTIVELQNQTSPPKKPAGKRGTYHHHESTIAMAMGAAVGQLDAHGKPYSAGQISNMSSLYGYTSPYRVPRTTVGGFAKQYQTIKASADGPAPQSTRKPHPRVVPREVKDAVVDMLEAHGNACSETTTKVALEFFKRSGREVSDSFLYNFLKNEGFGLYKAVTRPVGELDNEDQIEAEANAAWSAVEALRRDHGLKLHNVISYDEKPLFEETYKQKVIRRKHKQYVEKTTRQAIVKTKGLTRTRVTGIFPARAAADPKSKSVKLPPIIIFRGDYQLSVEVMEGYPVLVVFTATAMSNSEVFNYIVHNALLPNIEGKAVLLCDDHGSHFSETSMKYAEDWKTPTASLAGLCLHHPLSK